ncbi:hypothetical protein A3Q56_07484, partial [Intoshia linei]
FSQECLVGILGSAEDEYKKSSINVQNLSKNQRLLSNIEIRFKKLKDQYVKICKENTHRQNIIKSQQKLIKNEFKLPFIKPNSLQCKNDICRRIGKRERIMYNCYYCEKKFMDDSFLKSHITRRHAKYKDKIFISNETNGQIESQLNKIDTLKNDIINLKDRNQFLQNLNNEFEISLTNCKKSQEKYYNEQFELSKKKIMIQNNTKIEMYMKQIHEITFINEDLKCENKNLKEKMKFLQYPTVEPLKNVKIQYNEQNYYKKKNFVETQYDSDTAEEIYPISEAIPCKPPRTIPRIKVNHVKDTKENKNSQTNKISENSINPIIKSVNFKSVPNLSEITKRFKQEIEKFEKFKELEDLLQNDNFEKFKEVHEKITRELRDDRIMNDHNYELYGDFRMNYLKELDDAIRNNNVSKINNITKDEFYKSVSLDIVNDISNPLKDVSENDQLETIMSMSEDDSVESELDATSQTIKSADTTIITLKKEKIAKENSINTETYTNISTNTFSVVSLNPNESILNENEESNKYESGSNWDSTTSNKTFCKYNETLSSPSIANTLTITETSKSLEISHQSSDSSSKKVKPRILRKNQPTKTGLDTHSVNSNTIMENSDMDTDEIFDNLNDSKNSQLEGFENVNVKRSADILEQKLYLRQNVKVTGAVDIMEFTGKSIKKKITSHESMNDSETDASTFTLDASDLSQEIKKMLNEN